MLLDLEGFHVLTASNRTEALAAAQSCPDIAVLLADFYLMGKESGPDVVHDVRVQLGRAVPAVLLSGDITGAAESQAAANGLSLLRKPIRHETLMRVLHDATGRRADDLTPLQAG
ncbi:MAG: response regulator [Acetobacteraceae bacterium]